MADTVLRTWTIEEFLAWEQDQEGLYEFDGAEPIEMNPPALPHQLILMALIDALRLSPTPIRAIPSIGMFTKAGKARRIPDLTVIPHDVPLVDPVTSPLMIAEIISSSTRRTDTLAKVTEYTGLATLRHYLIVEQSRIGGTLHSRGDDGAWAAHRLHRGDVVSLTALRHRFPLDDLYAGLPGGVPPGA